MFFLIVLWSLNLNSANCVNTFIGGKAPLIEFLLTIALNLLAARTGTADDLILLFLLPSASNWLISVFDFTLVRFEFDFCRLTLEVAVRKFPSYRPSSFSSPEDSNISWCSLSLFYFKSLVSSLIFPIRSTKVFANEFMLFFNSSFSSTNFSPRISFNLVLYSWNSDSTVSIVIVIFSPSTPSRSVSKFSRFGLILI